MRPSLCLTDGTISAPTSPFSNHTLLAETKSLEREMSSYRARQRHSLASAKVEARAAIALGYLHMMHSQSLQRSAQKSMLEE